MYRSVYLFIVLCTYAMGYPYAGAHGKTHKKVYNQIYYRSGCAHRAYRYAAAVMADYNKVGGVE